MTNDIEEIQPVRRVVTGHDMDEVAKVLMDGPATNINRTARLIWCTDSTPCDMRVGEDVEDMGARQIGTPPPPNGTRFAVIDFRPGQRGAMHRTETIDYVIVLKGQLEMLMDDSGVTLSAGDVMVQRGTNHSWINRGPEIARVAFVLLDAKPLGIGEPVLGVARPG